MQFGIHLLWSSCSSHFYLWQAKDLQDQNAKRIKVQEEQVKITTAIWVVLPTGDPREELLSQSGLSPDELSIPTDAVGCPEMSTGSPTLSCWTPAGQPITTACMHMGT